MDNDGIICFRSILIKEVLKWWSGTGNWIHIFATKPMWCTTMVTVVLSIVEVFLLWIISKQWIHLCSIFRWRYHHRIHSHLINIKTLVQPIIWVLIEKENKTNKNELEQWDIVYGFGKLSNLNSKQSKFSMEFWSYCFYWKFFKLKIGYFEQ